MAASVFMGILTFLESFGMANDTVTHEYRVDTFHLKVRRW